MTPACLCPRFQQKDARERDTRARASTSPLRLECPGDAEKAIGRNTCWLGLSVAFHCKLQCPMLRACLHLTVGPREQWGTRGRCWGLLVCLTLHSTVEAETPELHTAAGWTPEHPVQVRLASTANACKMLRALPVGLSARREPRPLSKPFIASFNGFRLHLLLRAQRSRFGSMEAVFHPR